jgi:hypothetical protein
MTKDTSLATFPLAAAAKKYMLSSGGLYNNGSMEACVGFLFCLTFCIPFCVAFIWRDVDGGGFCRRLRRIQGPTGENLETKERCSLRTIPLNPFCFVMDSFVLVVVVSDANFMCASVDGEYLSSPIAAPTVSACCQRTTTTLGEPQAYA